MSYTFVYSYLRLFGFSARQARFIQWRAQHCARHGVAYILAGAARRPYIVTLAALDLV